MCLPLLVVVFAAFAIFSVCLFASASHHSIIGFECATLPLLLAKGATVAALAEAVAVDDDDVDGGRGGDGGGGGWRDGNKSVQRR